MYSPAAPLLQRCVIQIREGPSIEDLVREDRRLRGISNHHLDETGLDPGDELPEPVDVPGFVQAIVERLPNQWVVRDLQRTRRDVFLAGGQGGEGGRHQGVGLPWLGPRGGLWPASPRRDTKRAVALPAPG